LDDIAKHLNQQNVLSTDNYGWLQINYYQPSTQTRTFLMDEHEDGTLLTLVTATEKGLEFRTDDNRSGSISGDLNKLLIMPSEVLTLLTANKIKPLYHRVRNHPEIEKRFSVIYFVIPNERHYIAPWIENEFNQHIDIAKRSIENSLRYGLPTQ
jgi:isopenicillin N synthase-like dioxygenase